MQALIYREVILLYIKKLSILPFLLLPFILFGTMARAGSGTLTSQGISGNPGFENGTSGYVLSVPASFSINSTTTYIRSGTSSLRISTNSTSDLKASHTAGALTAPLTGYVTVIAWMIGENTNLRSKVGVYNSTTSTEYSGTTYTSSTASYTRVSATFSCVAGQTYYPVIFGKSASASTATGEYDDVVMYFSSASTVDITQPATSPTAVQATAAGNAITLSWSAGADAESGIDGHLVVRLSGISSTTVTPAAQVNYSTVSTEGPGTISSATVVYNGNATTFIDNTPATGSYTYLVYTRDKAYNYSTGAAAARFYVINGTGITGTLPGAVTVDGLYIAPGCTLATGSNVLTIRSGASFSVNGTINDVGGITNNGTVTFLSGSEYIFNRNNVSNPVINATWNDGSTATISGIRNFVPTGFDQSFANLYWNCTNQNRDITFPASFNVRQNFTLINTGGRTLTLGNNTISGNILQTGGTLSFTAGTTLVLDGSASQIVKVTGPLASLEVNNIEGVTLGNSITINTGLLLDNGTLYDSTFTLTMATGSTIERTAGALDAAPTLAGTIHLIYKGDITTGVEVPATGATNVTINTASAVTLSDPLRVNGILTFTNGDIVSTTTAFLHIADGGSVTGAGSNAHVNGPVRKTGNTAFTFPVGNGIQYAPLSISAPASATDAFTATYVSSSPATLGTDLGTGILRISNQEYWTLERTAGTSSLTAALNWNSTSGVTNLSDLRIARWTGTNWTSEGNASTSGTTSQGSITSAPLSSFGALTLGTSVSGSNPLPVELATFRALCKNESIAIQWITLSETNNDYFELYRSSNGFQFDWLAKVPSTGNTGGSTYVYTDNVPSVGTWYYRLHQTDLNGSSEKVGMAASNCGNDNVEIRIANYGQPVLKALAKQSGNYRLRITDITGKTLLMDTIHLEEGDNTLQLRKLPVNVLLFCTLSESNGRSWSVKFVLEN